MVTKYATTPITTRITTRPTRMLQPMAFSLFSLPFYGTDSKPKRIRRPARQAMANPAPPKTPPAAFQRRLLSTPFLSFDEIKKVGSFCPFLIKFRRSEEHTSELQSPMYL